MSLPGADAPGFILPAASGGCSSLSFYQICYGDEEDIN